MDRRWTSTVSHSQYVVSTNANPHPRVFEDNPSNRMRAIYLLRAHLFAWPVQPARHPQPDAVRDSFPMNTSTLPVQTPQRYYRPGSYLHPHVCATDPGTRVDRFRPKPPSRSNTPSASSLNPRPFPTVAEIARLEVGPTDRWSPHPYPELEAPRPRLPPCIPCDPSRC